MNNMNHRNQNDYDYYNDYHDYHDVYRDRYRNRSNYRKNKSGTFYILSVLTILSLISVLTVLIFSKIFTTSDALPNNTDNTVVSTTIAEQTTTSNTQNDNPNLPVSHDYFDNTVFVGDSVSVSFQMFVDNERDNGNECLGNAYILANGSLGYTNSIELPPGDPNSVLPIYKGYQQNLEDSIADIAPDRVYIMLGMNDITGRDPQDVLKYTKMVTDRIKEKLPNVKIFLESVTPKIRSAETSELNNVVIRTFNSALKEFAENNGYKYIDVYSAVCDEYGYLKEEYCSDPEGMGMHFTFEGDRALMNFLLNHPNGENADVVFEPATEAN